MNTYTPNPLDYYEVLLNGKPLDKKLHIANHSPTGFAWGYSGSGPAQLALAIMCAEHGDNLHHHPIHYQFFKQYVIAKLPAPPNTWSLTSEMIKIHIDEILISINSQAQSNDETLPF